MHKFLEKKELVSFSVAEGNHKIPKKKDFENLVFGQTTKNGTEKWTRLPNGQPVFLCLEGVRKFHGTAVSWTIEQEYKKGLAHGKYRVFCCREGSERKLVVTGEFERGEPSGTFCEFESVETWNRVAYVRGKVFERDIVFQGYEMRVVRNKKKGEEIFVETKHRMEGVFEKRIKEASLSKKTCRIRFFGEEKTADVTREMGGCDMLSVRDEVFFLDNFYEVKLSKMSLSSWANSVTSSMLSPHSSLQLKVAPLYEMVTPSHLHASMVKSFESFIFPDFLSRKV
ncbi:hypothetical protein A9K97_gp301 [Tokyovirus A1]|uniref:hypothetical protein n=1 Tax=Tokyovirus A1 TaxID=1826170 RepID=UPI0007A972C7|nr:hypothetical protein A9K97_gp301 [Tokyovirus A1]BAU80050.1 hypothetical protein [Tokyovirus A1]